MFNYVTILVEQSSTQGRFLVTSKMIVIGIENACPANKMSDMNWHFLRYGQILVGKCLMAHQYIEFCTNLFTINSVRQTARTQSENEYGRSCIPFLQSFPSKNELQVSSVAGGGAEVKRISMTKRIKS